MLYIHVAVSLLAFHWKSLLLPIETPFQQLQQWKYLACASVFYINRRTFTDMFSFKGYQLTFHVQVVNNVAINAIR